MKKIFIIFGLLTCLSTLHAKQCVEYFRYNFSFNVANDASTTLQSIIDKGYKIISFSLDYEQKCMIVVYDDGK